MDYWESTIPHSDVWKSLWTVRGKTKEVSKEAEESRITSIGVNCIRLCKEIYFPANSYSFMYHQSHIVVLLIRLIKGGASKTAVAPVEEDHAIVI